MDFDLSVFHSSVVLTVLRKPSASEVVLDVEALTISGVWVSEEATGPWVSTAYKITGKTGDASVIRNITWREASAGGLLT